MKKYKEQTVKLILYATLLISLLVTSYLIFGFITVYSVSIYMVQFIVIFMSMRSGFFVLRIWNQLTWYERSVYMTPILISGSLASYNLHDFEYLTLRYPFRALLGISSMWAIYELTKKMKENMWTVSNTIKEEWSQLEKKAFASVKANDDVIEVITKETLDVFKMFKDYGDERAKLKRMIPPRGAFFKFNCELINQGEFGIQVCPDFEKIINIDEGKVIETYSGQIYHKGQSIFVKPNQRHGIKSLERSSIGVYLYEVKK